VQKRLVINIPNFAVVIVYKDGITKMDTINPKVIAKAAGKWLRNYFVLMHNCD
jgi:hypothetical protein